MSVKPEVAQIPQVLTKEQHDKIALAFKNLAEPKTPETSYKTAFQYNLVHDQNEGVHVLTAFGFPTLQFMIRHSEPALTVHVFPGDDPTVVVSAIANVQNELFANNISLPFVMVGIVAPIETTQNPDGTVVVELATDRVPVTEAVISVLEMRRNALMKFSATEAATVGAKPAAPSQDDAEIDE